MSGPLRATHTTGLRNVRSGAHLTAPTLLSWPDARINLAEPGSTSCILAESGAKSGTVATFLLEQVREIWWS
jgi:hypothetical protein